MTLGAPPADWRGYRALALDVHVDRAVSLVLKVVDAAHDGTYADRFHRTFDLAPGGHALVVPLVEVEAGPAARRLALGRVAGVQLFAHGLDAPVVLHLDHVRLVPAERAATERPARPPAPAPAAPGS